MLLNAFLLAIRAYSRPRNPMKLAPARNFWFARSRTIPLQLTGSSGYLLTFEGITCPRVTEPARGHAHSKHELAIEV